MRKQSRIEENGANKGNGSFVRHAKVFGVKTMATVMTASMMLSGVPVQAIAEGIQTDDAFVESNVETSQDDAAATADDASSGQASDQGTTENSSAVQDNAADSSQNTQIPQASQAASQDKATTADIALTLNNASITYKGQVIAQPAQKVTAPANVDFKFSVAADNGFKLNEVKLTVNGAESKLQADANGEYTITASDMAKSPKVTLETEQEKQTEATEDATPIEDSNTVVAQDASTTTANNVDAITGPTSVKIDESITLTGPSNAYSWEWHTSCPDGENEGNVVEPTSGSGNTFTFKGRTPFIGASKDVNVTCIYYVKPGNQEQDKRTVSYRITVYKRAFKVIGCTYVKYNGKDTYKAVPTVVDADTGETLSRWFPNYDYSYVVDGNSVDAGTWEGNFTDSHKSYQCVVVPIENGKYYGTVKWDLNDNKVVNPSIAGKNKISVGDKTTYTASDFTSGVTWSSSDSGILSIDPTTGEATGVYPGTVTIYAVDKDGHSCSKEVTVDVNNSKGAWVYLYTKVVYNGKDLSAGGKEAEAKRKELGLTVNKDGWFTLGKLWVSDIEAASGSNTGQSNGSGGNSKIAGFRSKAIALLPRTIRYKTANGGINLGDVAWGYMTNVSSGATNYVNAGRTWHLDGSIDIKTMSKVTVHYVELGNKSNELARSVEVAAQTGSKFVPANEAISIKGYNFAQADPEITVEEAGTQEVYLYYSKGNYPYTVKYVDKDTGKDLADQNTVRGEYGSTVTVNALKFQGYNVDESEKSIKIGDGDNTVIFYYTKKSISYTIKYVWNGNEIAEGSAGTLKFGESATADARTIDGYTIIPDQTLTKTALDDDFTITVKYCKNVKLTAKSDSKTYSGKEQTLEGYTSSEDAAKFDGVTAKGAGTNVGEYEVAFNDGAQGAVSKDTKYIVSETVPGKLTISPVTDEVTIKVEGHKGGEKYNGKEQTVSGYDISSGLPAGLSKDDIVYNGTAKAKGTDAGTYPMNLDRSKFSLNENAAKNYTNVKFEVTDGELNIAKRKVTLWSQDGHKNYDGAALLRRTDIRVDGVKTVWNNENGTESEKAFDGDGFVKGEGVEGKTNTVWFNQKGDSDETNIAPGEYDNKFKVTFKSNTKESNYEITCDYGKLYVNKRVDKDRYAVTINAISKTDAIYNGKKQSVSGVYATVNNKNCSANGMTFINEKKVVFTITGFSASAEGTDAGTYQSKVVEDKDKLRVVDQYGNDVTDQFTFKTNDGELVINKRVVTIKPRDKSHEYNGKALKANDFEIIDGSFIDDQGIESCTYKGSQTQVGSSGSSIEGVKAKSGTDLDKNYEIKKQAGNLTVTDRNAKYQITVKAKSVEFPYDGSEHEVTGLEQDKFVFDDVEYTVSGLTADLKKTDAGTYTVDVTGAAKVTDPDGNDVTDQFAVIDEPGTLTISKRNVTLTAASDQKVYDGNPLTNNSVTVGGDGFATGEGTTYTVSGSQTDVGKSENILVDYQLNKNTKAGNYNITTEKGALEVTPVTDAITVKIKGNTKSEKYDGTRKSVEGYTVESISNDLLKKENITFKGDAKSTGTDASTYVMGLKSEQFSAGKNFSNVTFEIEDGSLAITKRDVTLTSATDGKAYDGTALTNDKVTVDGDGFAKGEGATYTVTGSQTDAGSSDNTFGYQLDKNTNAENYNITKKEGKLSITSLSAEDGLTIKPKNVEYTYDADSHAAGKASASASVDGIKVNLEYRVKGSTEWRADPSQITATNAGALTVEVRASADNYSGYKYVEQTLTINKRDVELSSASASNVYDGTALTKDWVDMGPNRKDTGFIRTDLADDGQIHATGSQTEVGSSDNTISYQLKKGKESNYNIMDNKLGTLEVTAQSIVPDPENPDSYKGITVSDPSDHVYDGKAHKWTPTVKDAAGDELTEGTDYTVSYDTDDFTNVKNIKATIAGTGSYTGTVTKTYKITPAPLTVNAKSGSKAYDGMPLTAGGTVEGLVEGETATVKTEGSQTEVGSSDNKVAGIEWGTAEEGNYRVVAKNNGTLTVTAKSIVPDPDDENNKMTVGMLGDLVYNGESQEQRPEVKDGEATLAESTDYTVSFSKDTKNVGSVTVTVTGKGNYAGTVERTYRITPATLTVNTPSDSKVYNGKALKAEGSITGFVNDETADFKTTGSQTKVGSSTNTYSIDWAAKESTAKKSNYTITENLGTLTVTETADEIVATPGSYKGIYDGQAHGVDVTVTGLPEGYSVKTAASSATVTDVNEGKPVTAKVDDLVIVNAQGEDVTNNLKITKGKGSIEITPATLTVTTPSASKAYDGTALTAEGKVSGFVNGEAAAFTTTGSQTKVGKSSNGYTLDWNDTAKKANYKVEENLGTLKVTKNMTAVMVIPQGGTKTYDGAALKSSGVTTYGLPFGYTLEAKTKGSVTNVGSATAEVDTYSIKDAKGADVTDQFGNVFTGKATLEVTKRPVTVTSATANKVYDGSALTKHEANVTAGSLVKGESFTYDFTGEQTTVGSTSNAYTVNAGKGTSLDNYKITKNDGTLAVTAKSIVPNPDDENNTMSVDAPENVKYDGQAHKWTPTVKDGDKTLAEGADYTVAYSKDDFTNVTGIITVTITGTGNYSGTVERAYEITKRSVKLTGVKNASKVYDGTPLEIRDVTVSGDGFVEGEVSDIKAIGSVTNVTAAPVDNPITFKKGDGFKAGNYSIATDPGTLEVTARSIDDADYGMSVDAPKDVEYDGQAHKWKPTVKDGDKTLVEGVDYAVTYGKDDFIDVTGTIAVTITGTGNYSGTVTRTYQVTPAKLTVETEGASKVYDGEPLTHDAATIKGLKNGETATVHATGAQTEVGESDNGYELTWDGSADEGNYTIAGAMLGKLVVTESADEIAVSPKNVETTYDGRAHGTTVEVTGLPKGYTVKTAKSKATAANVADGVVTAEVDELVIVNKKGEDVTSKLNIKRGTATIKITPAPLTVTTDGAEKEYDGTALTAGGVKVEGLKGDDSVSAKATGSRTKVGTSKNTYKIDWKGADAKNYTVTDRLGELKVTPSKTAVTLTSGSAKRAYNGRALTSDEVFATGLPAGFTVKAKMTGSQTDAGSSENTVESYQILDAKGDDVTDMFANVTVEAGTLRVTRRAITVETEGATKVYDGTALTNKKGSITGLVSDETADVVTNGAQTAVGSSDNGYTIVWGSAKETNYKVASSELGTLTVTPQSVNPNDPNYGGLTVGTPVDVTYDGNTHQWTPDVADKDGNVLTEGSDYTVSYDKDDFTDAGTVTVTVAGKGSYTGTVTRAYRIKPASVSIKTDSASKVYDGRALTAGGAIEGIVPGETVGFRVTGSRTKVGSSKNSYELAWNGTAKESNYSVDSIEVGTLTVTESAEQIVVTTTGGEFTYDGQPHGAAVTVSELPEGYTLEIAASSATATDATNKPVKATADSLVIRNAEGEDVTSQLNIKRVDGTIVVNPAELAVTTDSASKVYDGTALTAAGAITGLVNGETVDFETTGKQTEAGSSENGYKLSFDKTAKAKNYKVAHEALGTLTVTVQPIDPGTPGQSTDGYRGVTVDDPTDTVYDGSEHQWKPVVKDADGNELVEGTDYEIAYDTDDFTDVATIKATITGKGSYTGSVTKSYRITPARLTITTGSATKTFDGTALTDGTVTVDGLVERDRIGIIVTGSQTTVGSSKNTYRIDWMQANEGNYEVKESLGTLTVTPAPATPQTPTTPNTPTATTPTGTTGTPANNLVTTVTTALRDGYNAVIGNGQAQLQNEEQIFDAKNPLGKYQDKHETCWVHWYMIICAVATAVYGLFVGLRRNKHSHRLESDLKGILGDDDKTQE